MLILEIAAGVWLAGVAFAALAAILQARDEAWRPPPLTAEEKTAIAERERSKREAEEAEAEVVRKRMARTWPKTDLSHIPSQR